MTSRLKIAVAGAASLLFLGGTAFYFLRPPALDAMHPRIGPAVTAVYASGTVEPNVMLPVAPRVGGRLVALLSDEHDKVRKGQVLARLESADLVSNTTQLEANAAFASADLERDGRLLQGGAVARQVYDRAVATAQMANAAVLQAQAQAGFMTLSAPDSCSIIQRDGEIGQYIAADTPLFWLSCHASLRISTQVDEEDIPLVRVGQDVLIRADAFPGKIFDAKVTEVTPKGDPIGRSYRVRVNLPPDCPLEIGMTTEANIIIQTDKAALLLPASAVVDGKVWKVAAGITRQIPVTLGAKTTAWVEIMSGVARSDVILLRGSVTPPARPRINLVQP